MSKRHAGHFKDKHPSDTMVDRTVKEAVASEMPHQKITCKKAFSIASKLSVPPSAVGIAIDLQEGRITACQLGLFGHGPTDKTSNRATEFEPSLVSAIRAASEQGRLSCKAAWQIADAAQTQRLKISRVCDAVGTKISHCQLGAF